MSMLLKLLRHLDYLIKHLSFCAASFVLVVIMHGDKFVKCGCILCQFLASFSIETNQ